jgi:hypothetical protein
MSPLSPKPIEPFLPELKARSELERARPTGSKEPSRSASRGVEVGLDRLCRLTILRSLVGPMEILRPAYIPTNDVGNDDAR